MTSWAIVAIVAIVVWGIVQSNRARGHHDNRGVSENDRALEEENAAARQEIADLRERIRVLERIATDNNGSVAQERARIEREIEALRKEQD
ncbi:hypothetical protein [Qipengyuania spongiae]|uniref:Uncharacterized protein n=1 Tax=Qipengyuania spongiae TaxID=2909673 RepID=A0ABY5SXF2_9SPHN|nr:hypothetical protein [Qipengyuania spongiae]UVI39223.1 hypothetical protein L1F33_13485 [Qipengyuania spongiae]